MGRTLKTIKKKKEKRNEIKLPTYSKLIFLRIILNLTIATNAWNSNSLHLYSVKYTLSHRLAEKLSVHSKQGIGGEKKSRSQFTPYKFRATEECAVKKSSDIIF